MVRFVERIESSRLGAVGLGARCADAQGVAETLSRRANFLGVSVVFVDIIKVR
jgi:hypothetical protein